jgi:hypothetical protein
MRMSAWAYSLPGNPGMAGTGGRFGAGDGKPGSGCTGGVTGGTVLSGDCGDSGTSGCGRRGAVPGCNSVGPTDRLDGGNKFNRFGDEPGRGPGGSCRFCRNKF